MTRKAWIIVLVVVGVGLAVLIGLVGDQDGDSQAKAQQNFCDSVSGLQSSVETLEGLDPTTASKDDYQSAVSNVESSWDEVKADAGDLTDVSTSALDSAWDSFQSALDDIPDDASVSDALDDVSQSAQSLVSTTKSTLTGPDCAST